MIQLYNKKENCCGCTACMNICPKNAIIMKEDEEGFLYPVIDQTKCIECGKCMRVCEFQNRDVRKNSYTQKFYAFKHGDEEVRINSTSGGAFTGVTDYILTNNGIIYGACYDDNLRVVHGRGVTKEDRNKFRGSKYAQSNLGNIFRQIEADLYHDKIVLFSGTSCQTAALKKYIKPQYQEKLYLCDVACHGAPSPLIWEAYKKDMEYTFYDRIKKVNFRSKVQGWHNSTLNIDFGSGNYIGSIQKDAYYIMFFKHFILRPSCHKCKYASYERDSDITLADFWGIEDTILDMDDDKGVSLIMLNTKKGEEIINYLRQGSILKETVKDDCYQSIFEYPSKSNPKRKEFWQYYSKYGYQNVKNKYAKQKLVDRVLKKYIVPLLHKFKVYDKIVKIYIKLINV